MAECHKSANNISATGTKILWRLFFASLGQSSPNAEQRLGRIVFRNGIRNACQMRIIPNTVPNLGLYYLENHTFWALFQKSNYFLEMPAESSNFIYICHPKKTASPLLKIYLCSIHIFSDFIGNGSTPWYP